MKYYTILITILSLIGSYMIIILKSDLDKSIDDYKYQGIQLKDCRLEKDTAYECIINNPELSYKHLCR